MYKYFHYYNSTGEERVLIASTTFMYYDRKCVAFLSFEDDFIYAIDRRIYVRFTDTSYVEQFAQRISSHEVPSTVAIEAMSWARNVLVREGEVKRKKKEFQNILQLAEKYLRECCKQ